MTDRKPLRAEAGVELWEEPVVVGDMLVTRYVGISELQTEPFVCSLFTEAEAWFAREVRLRWAERRGLSLATLDRGRKASEGASQGL